MNLLANFVWLFVESAPFLLLGMLMAGLINQMLPRTWVEKTLGSNKSIFRAAIIGAPLPLCSCSVIPVAMGIRRSGANKSSTASFLVATPETGVDSIGVTYALMGPIMTAARPLAAIFSAVFTGQLIAMFEQKKSAEEINGQQPANKTSCCNKHHNQSTTLLEKFIQGIKFGYGQLLRDFMLWFLLGVFFAAIIKTYLPENVIADYAQGVTAMVFAAIISIPMYICATASTPLAVGLLLTGVTPGAALVFMLTGPATNIATLMLIKNELGSRELYLYLIGIFSAALLSGLILDWTLKATGWTLTLSQGHHQDMFGVIYQVSGLILMGLILYQLVKKYAPKLVTHTLSNK